MSEIQPQPIVSDLFLNFSPIMSDEKKKKQVPDGTNPPPYNPSSTPGWNSMFTPNPLVPNFTPSDWLNADTPSSFNFSFDYFNQLNDMQIPGQAGLDTAAVQAQAQQQQQQQVRANSGGMFNPNLWLFQEPDALAGSLNAGASGSGSASGVTIESTNERTSSSSSVSTSNHTPDIMGAPLGTVISGTSSSSAGPSRYDSSPQMAFDRPNAIPTSLLTSATNSQESIDSKPNIDSPDSFDDLTFSLSRVQSQASAGPSSSHRRSHSLNHGTLPHTHGPHPHSHLNPQYGYHPYADKRRASSFDSMDSSHEPDLVDLADVDDHEHGLEHELGHEHDGVYEIHEGIERDGMIWGMKVEEYRALSARERKRVRNRISARTFRAKRKEHLTSLETDLNSKDVKIRHAQEEAHRLRREVAELKKRLSKYEVV